jgi:hypothetical protein
MAAFSHFLQGNTCYLNSTLQALSNTVALRRYYDEGHYKARKGGMTLGLIARGLVLVRHLVTNTVQ